MVVVRSVRTLTFTADGSALCSCGRSSFTRSTTSIRFAPGWRWMLTIMAGSAPIHAACRMFSAPSITSATSERSTGALLRKAMTSGRYWWLCWIWSLAAMVKDWNGPSRLPFAWLTFAAATAARTSSMVRPLAASRAGLTWMRTAGFCPPDSVTSPTPGSCAIFCTRRVSARSSTTVRGNDVDVSPSVSTGASAGFTLL